MAESYPAGPTGKTVSTDPKLTLVKKNVYQGRITETFLLSQWNYHADSETNQDIKNRLSDSDKLYRGELNELFPDETALPDKILVANKFKGALHDHSRLSAEGRGMPRVIPRGDKDDDKRGARIREAIHDTYWVVGRGKTFQRSLYMDLAGAGLMAVACFYNDDSIYPQYARLNPRYCYPDVRNGRLISLVYIETIKERIAAAEHPEIPGLDLMSKGDATVDFIAYYDKEEVCEAYIKGGPTSKADPEVFITQRWRHGLERIPVAFHQLATYDGVPRGIFDQLGGPMMVRNKIVRFAVDYLEQMAHSPLWADGILNADETPGPLTVYKSDPDWDRAPQLTRVGPAGQSTSMWNLLSYMGDQEEKEAIQPATRTGNVKQSQASGSFVQTTQGTQTSVIIEMQEGMADLREQLNIICNVIDERHLDVSKPLIRSVGKKRSYSPKRDIGGWYYHTIEFGAGAGLDKLNTDNRVLNHVAGRLIDRGTAREQIDYLDDSYSIQEKIDAENIADALLQRFATDPATPISALAQAKVLMDSDGLTLTEALNEVVPGLLAHEQAQTNPEGAPVPGAVPGAEGQQLPPEGAPPAPGGETPIPVLPKAPMQQLFGPVQH